MPYFTFGNPKKGSWLNVDGYQVTLEITLLTGNPISNPVGHF